MFNHFLILKILGRANDKCMERRRCVIRIGICFDFFYCWLYRYGLSKHKFFVCERQLMKILGFIFSGDLEKNHVEFFDAGILRV